MAKNRLPSKCRPYFSREGGKIEQEKESCRWCGAGGEQASITDQGGGTVQRTSVKKKHLQRRNLIQTVVQGGMSSTRPFHQERAKRNSSKKKLR